VTAESGEQHFWDTVGGRVLRALIACVGFTIATPLSWMVLEIIASTAYHVRGPGPGYVVIGLIMLGIPAGAVVGLVVGAVGAARTIWIRLLIGIALLTVTGLALVVPQARDHRRASPHEIDVNRFAGIRDLDTFDTLPAWGSRRSARSNGEDARQRAKRCSRPRSSCSAARLG
jgi:hypothetical protein